MQKTENNRGTSGVSGEVDFGPILVQYVSQNQKKTKNIFKKFKKRRKQILKEERHNRGGREGGGLGFGCSYPPSLPNLKLVWDLGR